MSNFKQKSFSNRYFIIIITVITAIFFGSYAVFNSQMNNNSALLIGLLAIVFLILALMTVFWIKYKLYFESGNDLDKNGKIPPYKMLLLCIYFSSFYTISMLILINWYNNLFTNSSYFSYLLFLLISLNNIILLIQFNSVFKQLERPNAYIFKFLNKKIGDLSNDFETTFTLKTLSITIVFIIPFALTYFISKNIIVSYIFISLSINILIGSYWIGYGLYKQLIWIWGFQSDIHDNSTKRQKITLRTLYNNFKYKEGKSVSWGFIFLIFSTILLLTLIVKGILVNSSFPENFMVPIFILYLLVLYSISLNITGKRTRSQPWYSVFFTMYSFSIPFSFLLSYFYVFNQSNVNFTNILPSSIVFKEIMLILLIISILLAFSVNNRYLSIGLWKNHYEATQTLNRVDISNENPSIIQLNLLQKIGNLMEDRETIQKLIATYKEILEGENTKTKNEFFFNIYVFINNQLSLDTDDETYELLFNLANILLDVSPSYSGKLFDSNLQLLKEGNSVVKNGSLNILGHILQYDPQKDYAEKIFIEIEKIYQTNDEKLKRLILDALIYFIRNFSEYASRIKKLITAKLEYETFGIATIIFSLLDEIYQLDHDKNISELAKNTLKTLDSPAKLGAVNFFRNNLPSDQKEKDNIVKILLDNLKDIDNAMGIRTNVIYTINDLIKEDKNQNSLLSEIKQYISDFDPDVKSAVIQSFTEQYILRNANFSDVTEVFERGMEEHDYIVRLVVIQSIKSIKDQNQTIDKDFRKILEKASHDESKVIQDEVKEIINN